MGRGPEGSGRTCPSVADGAEQCVMLFRAACASLLVAGSAAAADWPRFLGPTGDGISPETNLVSRIPETGLPIVFDRPVGTGYAAPSVAGGRLILFHRLGDQEVVECWDAVSAAPRWKSGYPTAYQDPYGYNNGPRCAPLISGDRVYTFGAEGKLSAYDLASGARLWQRDTAKEFQVPEAFFGVGSTPLLEDGKLIVMVGGQPDSGVVAFNPATGATLWQSVGQKNWEGVPMTGWPGEAPVRWGEWWKQASYSSPVAATVHGKRVVFCLMRQGLVALDPADGSVRFSRWFRARVEESVNAANPVVLGNDVLISSAYYRTGSVNLRVSPGATNFTENWRGLGLEMHWSTPVWEAGNLYGFSGRNEPDASFRCVDFKTGEIRWQRDERWSPHSAAQPPVFGRGSCILADGKLIALGEGGLVGLYRPDPTACQELGRWQVPTLTFPCWAGPVLSNGRLYLRSEKHLVCLDVRR